MAVRQIIYLSQQQLNAYQRTIKGDKDLLIREDITRNQHNIYSFTLEEKRALISLIKAAEWVETVLMMKNKEAIEFIRSGESSERPNF